MTISGELHHAPAAVSGVQYAPAAVSGVQYTPVAASGVTVPHYGVEGRHAVLYCRYALYSTRDMCTAGVYCTLLQVCSVKYWRCAADYTAGVFLAVQYVSNAMHCTTGPGVCFSFSFLKRVCKVVNVYFDLNMIASKIGKR